jgi:acetyl-CoA C-acetyltransferase
MEKTRTRIEDYDLFEINEAFAAQAVANAIALRIDPDRLNVNGGAIALGHPIGASGARVLVTLLHALQDRGGQRGIASLCLGGGEAVALAVEML